MDNVNKMTYEDFMSQYGHWHKASDGYPIKPGWYWFASIITDEEGKKKIDIYSDRIYAGVDSDELYLKDNFLRHQTLDQFMQLNNVSYWVYAFIPHAVFLTKEGDILLSREEALKLHRQMWSDMLKDLGNRPTRHARITYKYNWCKEHGYRPQYNCFLCQYVVEQENISGIKDPKCTKCPIDWPGGGCGSVECNFLNVPIEDILKLPEKKVKE